MSQAPGFSLHIGAHETVVTDLSQALAPISLALGSQVTPARWFRQDPPGEADMDYAIQAVEDIVMPLHRVLPAGSLLTTSDSAIREIALLAGVTSAPTMNLALQPMEAVFNRLADVVSGTPAARAGIPGGPAFAATLLILREFMHHLKFETITIQTGTRT